MRVGSRALGGAAALALLALSCGRSNEQATAPSAAAKPTAAPASASTPAASVETTDTETRKRREAGGRAPVIWLGLDGLDWELLDRLAAQGRMPNWKRLTAEGYTAKLKSFMPVLSPVVWTTIATGVGPDVHRILDFQEVDPKNGQKVPISGDSRAVPAVWNVASASGLTVGVVGWWATHPAEEVKGFFVSDHASPILFKDLPRAGVAYPKALAAGVEQIIARDGRVSDAELARFVDVPPDEIARLRASGQALDNPIVALSNILGATRTQQRIARDLYDRTLPDLMVVYFEGTDGIGHVFASFEPPRMACVSEADFARYHRAVDEYYALVDRMIGQWMRRAEEDGATLVVNSDHGFKWGEDRPCERSSLNPSTAAFWHRLDGVFAAWGPRVRRGQPRGAATVFDVAPTVSALLGLPVDRAVRGGVIAGAFEGLSAPPKKDLFRTITVRRVQAEAMSDKEASDYAQRLRNLGYLSGSEPEKLAPSGGERPGLTEGGLEQPRRLPAGELEGPRRGRSGVPEGTRAAAGVCVAPVQPGGALSEPRRQDSEALDWLFRSLAGGHADPQGTVLQWFGEYTRAGQGGPGAGASRAGREGISRQREDRPRARRSCASRPGTARERSGRWPGSSLRARTPTRSMRSPSSRRASAAGTRRSALFEKSLRLKPGQPGVIRSLNLLKQGPPTGR